jgi:hypothetical protein
VDIEPLLPRWIACEEQLPSVLTDVLVAHGGRCTVAELDKFRQWWSDGKAVAPTHWMTLPPLPQIPE